MSRADATSSAKNVVDVTLNTDGGDERRQKSMTAAAINVERKVCVNEKPRKKILL
jgi:hypothetical protein